MPDGEGGGVVTCINCNYKGETSCQNAYYDVCRGCMACNHPCVVGLNEKLMSEREARIQAEKVLAKYREAVKPFLSNCRAIVEYADKLEAKEVTK